MNDERRQEMMAENIRRRESIGGLAAMSVAANVPGAHGQSSNGEMPYRTLGKTASKFPLSGSADFTWGFHAWRNRTPSRFSIPQSTGG